MRLPGLHMNSWSVGLACSYALVGGCACGAAATAHLEEDASGGKGVGGAATIDVAGASAGGAAQLQEAEGADVPALGMTSTQSAPMHAPIAECQNLANGARAVVLEAATSTPQCLTDTDCRAYETTDLQICWASCESGWRGSADHERAIRAAIGSESVQANCGRFRELGCQLIALSCPLSPQGRVIARPCVDHVCNITYE
jgi:hypothetical protein